MAFGKSAEEKARAQNVAEMQAANQARLAGQAQRAGEQVRTRSGPIGQATDAMEHGDGFLEIQLVVGASIRQSSVFDAAGQTTGSHTSINNGETLARIEALGWRLEHVGYVFQVTGEASHDRFLGAGENIAVSGRTVGIYLFRNMRAL
ncbi:MAG TPA: hypothetical protein VGJ28_27550 [Micromonosporaceae bacterium]|jgi:hypothetical protein